MEQSYSLSYETMGWELISQDDGDFYRAQVQFRSTQSYL